MYQVFLEENPGIMAERRVEQHGSLRVDEKIQRCSCPVCNDDMPSLDQFYVDIAVREVRCSTPVPDSDDELSEGEFPDLWTGKYDSSSETSDSDDRMESEEGSHFSVVSETVSLDIPSSSEDTEGWNFTGFSFVAEDSLTRDAPKEEETLPPPDDRDQPDLLKEDVDEDASETTNETTSSSGGYDASSEASSSDETTDSTTSSSKFLDRARARGRSCKNIFVGFVCAVIVKRFVNNFVLL